MESHTAGLSTESLPEGSWMDKAVGECPVVTVDVGPASARCLLDTGAQVSTLTESFFRDNLLKEGEPLDVSSFIKITGANGLEIPYLGYVELDLVAFGKVFPNMGFLVVKDPEEGPLSVRKRNVPGVIGCNILRFMKSDINDFSVWQSVLLLFEETFVDKQPARRIRVSRKRTSFDTSKICEGCRGICEASCEGNYLPSVGRAS